MKLHRGRLFRKYFLLILLLVCGTLVISGGIGLYFAYQENKGALASLQREKAGAAAARIEQFVQQIERQVAFAALLSLGPDLEQRRVEFLKVLKLSPEVTDIVLVGADGRELLLVSRLQMEAVRSLKDHSKEPAFREAQPGETWFGPVTFRKDTEPYMKISVRGGKSGPVTVADVNLKFMWDVIQRIKIGEKGKAYVIDATGHLIADPDIGLVLRKTDLSQLEQVKAALSPGADDAPAMLARGHAGNAVLTAWAPVEDLGWKVFVEQPVSEVFAALDATILRTVALLVAGLLFSALAAMSLARSMVRPISTLQEGAARIGAGDLDQRIEIKTGDELETLADEFNRMTSQLRESYAGLEKKVEERTRELQEALEQQTATAEILKVISSSPTDVQPVLEAIVRSAASLFHPCDATIVMRNGDLLERRARSGPTAADHAQLDTLFPVPFDPRISVSSRAIAEARILELLDTEAPEHSEISRKVARAAGFRSATFVPFVRDGVGIGALGILHPAAHYRLTEKQKSLLRTFADQAVIAIENVRLFNETKEALEQQTATSEILKVISSSTTDTQPVFESIVRSGLNLFPDAAVAVVLPDGDRVRMTAVASSEPGIGQAMLSRFPIPLTREYMHGVAILDRRLVDVPDGEQVTETSLTPGIRNFLASGARAITIMPMMRGDTAIGAISVTRVTAGALSEKQVALLRTFADQAVIAIENVRLFNETKESLEQQTATAEILKVISSSTTDVQPVLEAIVKSAVGLFPSCRAVIQMIEGDRLFLRARQPTLTPAEHEAVSKHYPLSLAKSPLLRAITERRAVEITDAHAPEFKDLAIAGISRAAGFRSITAVPLIRGEEAIGLLSLSTPTPGFRLDEKQLALLKTFADQAVIAIENVRLFNETKEALEQQTATAEVLNVISGSITDASPVFDAISRSVLKLYGADHVARLYVRVGDKIDRVGYAVSEIPDDGSQALWPIPLDDKSLTGRAILGEELVHIKDTETEPGLSEQSREIIRKTGVRSVLIAPMRSMGTTIGALSVGRRTPGGFTDREVELIRTFADQAVIAMENVRLFREIQDKSGQLEIANKHKSDFLANMSHELRTPLNAIIGFSEVLMERMFGEVNAKQADYLKDIHESGKHLLSLINDILDLSKIEAGRMDLEISAFDLPSALSNAMTLVRERAQRHGIALGLDVDKRLGEFRADERKFKQIVVNLLSNAVKFTPDGGKVDVFAKHMNSEVEIAVRDTGIGIAPEDQQLVFEEFKQAGRNHMRKSEGTGLGLALTKRFVELHGGGIRLESALGKGSTFTITLPLRTS